MSEPIVNIVDVMADAVQGPAERITVGCFIFDVGGDRHEVTGVWLTLRTIIIARAGQKRSEADTRWQREETVTYVPKPVH